MQNISGTAAALLRGSTPQSITIACSGRSGLITITQADIVSGSFSIDRNSVSGSDLELGNAETSEIGFNLDNTDGRFNRYTFAGATLTVDLVIGAETLRLGVFTVDIAPKKGLSMKIVALDNMAKFNVAYASALTGTPTLLQLVQECCTYCGVTLNTTGFTNNAVTVNVPADPDLTFHEVICLAAELAGACAWIDADGELNLTWYGENQGATEITIASSDLYPDYNIDEQDITVTGIMIKDSTASTLSGELGYVLVIDSNPLVITANKAAILAALNAKIVGLTYRPYSLETIGMPHLWPLDQITIALDDPIVTSADGIDLVQQASSADMQAVVNGAGVSGADLFVAAVPDPVTYIMNHRYILNGKSRFAAKGKTAVEAGYAAATPFSSVQKTNMVKLTKQVVAVMGLIADWLISGKLSAADGSSWFDLDLPEIVQTAVINSKNVRVEMSPANPFLLEMQGVTNMQKYIYVTDDTGYSGPNILVTSKYDINEDGVVDWKDSQIVFDYVLHKDISPGVSWPAGYPDFARMDVNDNGAVNSSDVYEIFTHQPSGDRVANGNGQLGINSIGPWLSHDGGETITQFTPILPDQSFTNQVSVVFGQTAHGGNYYSSMIPLADADLYTITSVSVSVLDGSGSAYGTTRVDQVTKLGFVVKNNDVRTSGEAAFVNFTIALT